MKPKSLKLLGLLPILLLSLSGCSEFKGSEVVKAKIIGINPPKHFKIIVEIPGEIEPREVSISKHCQVKPDLIGKETLVNKNFFEYPRGEAAAYHTYSKYYDKNEYCE